MSLLERMERERRKKAGLDEFASEDDRERPQEPEWRRRAKEGKLDPKALDYSGNGDNRGYDG